MNFIWALAFLVISYTIQALTAKKPQVDVPQPSQLKDFNFPQFDEGTPESVVFGDVWCDDWMILYYGNLRSVAITQKRGGKK